MSDPAIHIAQQPLDAPRYQPPFASPAHLVEHQAQAQSDQPYLIAYDADGLRRPYSFAAFAQRVRRFAGMLARRSIGPGDRIATILHNHLGAVFLMYAAWWLGAAVLPVNIEEGPARKRFILADGEVKLLFTLPEYLPEIEPHRPELPPLREIIPVGAQLDPGITGRIKELIIRGGVNLSPLEIDAVLALHPSFRFGMAVPFENRIYGEEVGACVVIREGFQPTDYLAEAIKRHYAGVLPFPMQPKVVLCGSDLPCTSTGKPERLTLKAQLAERLREYYDVQVREGRNWWPGRDPRAGPRVAYPNSRAYTGLVGLGLRLAKRASGPAPVLAAPISSSPPSRQTCPAETSDSRPSTVRRPLPCTT